MNDMEYDPIKDSPDAIFGQLVSGIMRSCLEGGPDDTVKHRTAHGYAVSKRVRWFILRSLYGLPVEGRHVTYPCDSYASLKKFVADVYEKLLLPEIEKEMVKVNFPQHIKEELLALSRGAILEFLRSEE